MRPLEATFRSIRSLHAWLCLSAAVLLAVTVWMVAEEYRRPWRRYQRAYRRLTDDAPEARPPGASPAIEQIWLPDLTID